MASQDDNYNGQDDHLADYGFDNFGDSTGNNGGEFEGVDFSSYPPLDEAGGVAGFVAPSIDPMSQSSGTNLNASDGLMSDWPQYDMNLASNQDPIMPDFAGDNQIIVGSNIDPSLPGTNTQAMAPLPAGYAFDISGPNQQLAMPAWNSRAYFPSASAYQPPLVPTMADRQLTKRKQDSRTAPYQPTKRRPTMPENFIPHIDTQNPPRRESEVHDEKGCKDTTLASDYYYRINSLPPLKDFYGKGSDITYQGPEFHKKVEFTGAEFMRYLRTSQRGPVLIVQLQPQKCNHRYIRGGQSFKCRNKNCPDPKRTILKGHFRVCITEFYDSEGHWVNPFQSAAGYLHLYCLENMLNLSEIVADVPVAFCPEVRNFKHEPSNPMELSKSEQRTFQQWVDEFLHKWTIFRDQYTGAGIPRDQWPALEIADEDRLYRRLTAAHLKKNPGTVKMAEKRRAKAGGKKITAHVDQVLGDVGKHVAAVKRRRDACAAAIGGDEGSSTRAAAAQPSPEAEPSGKRRRLNTNHSYNLRSASPRKSQAAQASQPQYNNQFNKFQDPLPINMDEVGDFEFENVPTQQFDEGLVDQFLGTGSADPFSAPLPGDSVVEQSIVVNTDAVTVPALTSPPRTRRSGAGSSARNSPLMPKSPGVQNAGVRKRRRSSSAASSRRSSKRLSSSGNSSLNKFLEEMDSIAE